MLLMSYNKYLPEENLFILRQKLESMDEDKVRVLYSVPMKDPVISLVLSLVAGYLGADRFYIGYHSWRTKIADLWWIRDLDYY